MVTVERNASSNRIERDIETLAGAEYTLSEEAIRRYAYTDVYRNTLDYFKRDLQTIGFEVSEDPVGRSSRETARPGSPHSASAHIATRIGTAASTTERWASSPHSRSAA